MKIGLLGCVKTKRPQASPAGDLYISPLFRYRRRYVERSCDTWFILSAKHGLAKPQKLLEPYDVTLNGKSVHAKREWAQIVIAMLKSELGDLSRHSYEIHAGDNYRAFGLEHYLQSVARVEVPTNNLAVGQQLAFYKAALAHERP